MSKLVEKQPNRYAVGYPDHRGPLIVWGHPLDRIGIQTFASLKTAQTILRRMRRPDATIYKLVPVE